MNPTLRRNRLPHAIFGVFGLALTFFAVGYSPASAQSPEPVANLAAPNLSATTAVRALVGSDPASMMRALPTDFASVMGYRPVLDGHYPINPAGSCSSPVPLPSRFEPLCRTHDLGYDLLRYAQAKDQPLGSWARLSLDSMLIRRMSAACTNPICDASARVARFGLGLNTWRQYDAAPIAGESSGAIISDVGRRGAETLMGRRLK